MTPAQLLEGAQALMDRFPTAELVKNQVGNLAVMVEGEYVGYLDLRYGTLEADED